MADRFEKYKVSEQPVNRFEQYKVQAEEPESFGTSLGYAIPRIATDIGKGAYNAVQSIPQNYESAKKTITDSFNVKNPNRANELKQLTAGLAEHGHNVFNLPHDLINYATNRLNLIPQNINKKVQMGRMPSDTQELINQFSGQPQGAGEEALRWTGKHATGLSGAAKLIRAAPHLTQRGASRKLTKAQRLAKEREIGKLDVDPELINDARQFVPNTLPNRNALDAARTGDYHDLFRLQSDVGKNASDYARSIFSAAERQHGKAGLGTRNRLLDAIHENLQSQGHHDISNLLRGGQKDYSRYMKFKPYRNALAGGTLLGAGLSIHNNPLARILKGILFPNNQ